MKKWKVLESDYIYKTPWGNLRRDRCQLPNGYIIENYYVNEYTDWVNVIAITRDLEVVFITQYRHGLKDFILEVPAGAIEDKEDYFQAIARELKEETGYASDKNPILLGDLYTNPAIANNCAKTFLMLDAYKVSEQNLDITEDIEISLIPFKEVGEMIREGKLRQLFSVTAYYLAKDYLEVNNLL